MIFFYFIIHKYILLQQIFTGPGDMTYHLISHTIMQVMFGTQVAGMKCNDT